MKKDFTDLALFGGEKSFAEVLPVGQFNFPQWEKIEAMCEGVFDRHYFTNHGVLAQELEELLCSYLGVRNAVTLTNESISMIYTATALGLSGKVIVPSVSPLSTIQSLTWYGLETEFCDVDKETFLLNADTVRPILERSSISAIVATHLWGAVCDTQGLDCLAEEYGIPVIYDATHAFGCGADSNKVVGASGAAEVFSFNAESIINAGEGGVVATDDDDIAEQLRNLRSSYGRLKNVEIPLNGNGRFSEFQAGMALLSFADLDKNIRSNRERKLRYKEKLQSISGVDLLFEGGSKCNHQWVVVSINEQDFGLDSRVLMKLLREENICIERPCTNESYLFPPYSRYDASVFPVAESIASNVMLLPSGEAVTLESVDLICSLIAIAQKNSKKIIKRLHDD